MVKKLSYPERLQKEQQKLKAKNKRMQQEREKKSEIALNKVLKSKFGVKDSQAKIVSLSRIKKKIGFRHSSLTKIEIEVSGRFPFDGPHGWTESWTGKIQLEVPKIIEKKFRMGQTFKLVLEEE